MVKQIKGWLKKRCITIFSITLLLLASIITVPAALAASHRASSDSPTTCHTLLVRLNGAQSPTQTCLDMFSNTGAMLVNAMTDLVPSTDITSSCATGFELFLDTNYSGDTICFIGQGFIANLEDFCLPYTPCLFGNWNDNASSYAGGCSQAYLYADSDGNGQRMAVSPYAHGNFNGSKLNHDVIPDDMLSSLELIGYC